MKQIPCEGGGCPGHWTTQQNTSICSMCGQWVENDSDGNVNEHTRPDILAAIDAGEFDS